MKSQVCDWEVWKELENHKKRMEKAHMRDMFHQDSNRFQKFSVKFQDDLLLDYSKNLVDEAVMKSLFKLASEAQVFQWRDKMFNGEKINNTENRAVLHIALRNR